MRPAGSARAGADEGGRTVLLADGDPGALARTRRLFEDAGHRVRVASSGEEALQAAAEERPAAAVLEVNLPGVCGYEVCRRLRALFAEDVWIVFLSEERTEPFDRVAGLLLGADDYLAKPFAPDELLARVEGLMRHSDRPADGSAGLTRREDEVLRLLARGLSNREIGRELVISPKTVSAHVDHILAKLSVHSRAHAIAEAYRTGLLKVA